MRLVQGKGRVLLAEVDFEPGEVAFLISRWSNANEYKNNQKDKETCTLVCYPHTTRLSGGTTWKNSSLEYLTHTAQQRQNWTAAKFCTCDSMRGYGIQWNHEFIRVSALQQIFCLFFGRGMLFLRQESESYWNIPWLRHNFLGAVGRTVDEFLDFISCQFLNIVERQ